MNFPFPETQKEVFPILTASGEPGSSSGHHRILTVKLLLLAVFTLGWFRLCVVTTGSLGSRLLPECVCLALIWWAVLAKHKIPAVLPWVYMAVIPALHFVLLESIQQHTRDMVPKMMLLNFIFYYAAFLFLFFVFRGHSEWAVFTGTVLTWLSATVNAVCWQFRSLPVLPWDLYSAKIALSVADNYQFTYSDTFWFTELCFVTLAVLGFRLRVRQWAPKVIHWPAAAVSFGLLVGFICFAQTDAVFTEFGGYRYLFTPTVYYERNGTAVSFLSTLHYLNVDKPAGYRADNLSALSAEYPGDAAPSDGEDYPNVIVIMNEAFSDLRPLGEFTTNIPVTPFIDSLDENTVKGDLYVSVKGGNTANTEYEFLTGDTMAFLPVGSIPYQQYIKEDVPSLVTHLSSLGYETAAIHPYYASGWFRNTVYPYLGFDSCTFLEDMRPLYSTQVVRNYYSDAALFDKIADTIEWKDTDAPMFVFAVTMQNHGSYDEEFRNFKPDITVDGIEDGKRLSAYLSLIRKTDDAFAALVNRVKKWDEKTVILMFGDHQPNDSVIYQILSLNGVAYTTVNLDAENRYITPYVLWANYDITETEADKISVNYLSSLLCETAGIPRSGYQTYLSELYESYPVISARSVIDAKGNHYSEDALDALLGDKSSPLNTYQMFSYSHVFDAKNRPASFY